MYEVVKPWLQENAQWLVAIGTLALAMVTFITLLVTLIVTLFLPWRRRPWFTIEFANCQPYCRPLPPRPIDVVVIGRNERGEAVPFVQRFPSAESYWLRLKVTNSGKSVAKNCSGRLVKFMDNSKELEGHDLVKLHWINTPWSRQEFFPSIDLNRGEHDFLDVLVTRPEYKRKELLFMSPENLFSDNPDMVPEGTCRIQVTVYGDNVEPCSKKYSITWEGSNYTDITLKGK